MIEADWNKSLVDEINDFGDDAEHDDQVTALALGYNKLVHGMFGSLTWGRDKLPDNVVPIRHGLQRNPDAQRLGLTW
jgi:hypothetical protein